MYRSILRNIARTNLQNAGVDRLNKPIKTRLGTRTSKFATNWRKWVKPNV